MKKILLILLVFSTFFSCKEDEIPIPTALHFDQNEVTIKADGESVTVGYKTTSPSLTLETQEGATWCTAKLEGENLVITADKNDSFAPRETSVKVKALDRETTIPIKQVGQPSTKIKVVSGWASSFHQGEDIDKSFDGTLETMYHSEWGFSAPTYTLDYTLGATASVDLISYYPRSGGGNGTFGAITIYGNTASNSEFVKIMDFDCAKSKTASHIVLPTSFKNPKVIRIVVDGSKSVGGFASCAEIEFYRKGE